MASPGGKHRQFNDGTRPPDSTPATTGSPTSNQPADSFRKQIFHRPIENGDEKGLEEDSESAKNASQQSNETIVDVNLTRNDDKARSDFTQPAPLRPASAPSPENSSRSDDASNQAPKKPRVDGIFVPSPSDHCLSETEDDRTTELQDFRPDNVRPGEPAVLDVERSHDARVEINRDLGGA